MLGESKNMPCCFFFFFFNPSHIKRDTNNKNKLTNNTVACFSTFTITNFKASTERNVVSDIFKLNVKIYWLHKPAAYTPTVNWVEIYKHSIC